MRPALPIAVLASLAAPAAAQTFVYDVELIGGQSVPTNGSGGIGQASIKIDVSSGAFSVSGNYLNLTASASAAHIHGSARRGATGGILAGLTLSGGTSGTIGGSGTLTPSQVTTLRDGLAYVNVHTGAFPGGEIRGQIEDVPASGSSNAPNVTITGDATPGGGLKASCPPSINQALMFIGLALPSGMTLPLPASVACSTPSNIGFDVAFPFIPVMGGSVGLPIPPGLPNFELAFQCAFVPLGGTCIDLSAANRVAIRP